MGNDKMKNLVLRDLGRHLVYGIKFVIPLIMLYSILLFLGSREWKISFIFAEVSPYIYLCIVPLLSAFIAKSIIGYNGFAPALLAGYLADYTGMGFIGGMITGVLIGYFLRFSYEYLYKYKTSNCFKSILTYSIIPAISLVIIGSIIYFVFAPPLVFVLDSLFDLLVSLSNGNLVFLAIVIGAMTTIDLGGPFNKVAFAFVLSAFLEGLYDITGPALVAVAIPPLSLGLATLIIPKIFNKEEIKFGKTAFVLGLVGITEGALPFAVKDPLVVIPSVVIGSSFAAGAAAYLHLSNSILASSLIGIIGTSDWILYVLVHITGVTLCIFSLMVLKYIKNKKLNLSK